MSRYHELQSIMERYARHFRLDWASDISEWSDDIGPLSGGGAYRPGPVHEPPMLYMAFKADCKEPVMYMTYAEEKAPGPEITDVVTDMQLLHAIEANEPLHDTTSTMW